MSRLSPMQPVAGEIVLHCAHAREVENPLRTYRSLGGDLTRLEEIEIDGHVVWDGDAPVIVEDFS